MTFNILVKTAANRGMRTNETSVLLATDQHKQKDSLRITYRALPLTSCHFSFQYLLFFNSSVQNMHAFLPTFNANLVCVRQANVV